MVLLGDEAMRQSGRAGRRAPLYGYKSTRNVDPAGDREDPPGPWVGTAPRGRRKNSVPMAIRSTNGEPLGALKLFREGGRLEFSPASPLPEPVAERIADAVKAVLQTELMNYLASQPEG